ncbi:MAG: ATP-binding protein [Gammaproteobacteria bacterium]
MALTIRRELMLAFLLFTALFAGLTATLVYARSRATLAAGIRHTLEAQAQALAQQVASTIFERVQDARGWQRLDVMQELKVGDVDKRLARFLHEVTAAYEGTYVAVLGIAGGRVVAASDAQMIGMPVTDAAPWLAFDQHETRVALERPDPAQTRPVLTLRLPLTDAFTGGALGELQARVDWREIEQLLDQLAHGGRDVVLLDAARRPLARSAGLRGTRDEDLARMVPDASPGTSHGVFDLAHGPRDSQRALVGFARVEPFKSLPSLGWSVAVLTPEDVAFAPVRTLLWSLGAPFLLLAIVAGLIARQLSARLARPLHDLAGYARTLGRDLDATLRTIPGSREIAELCAAFNRTVEDLRKSRTQLVRASKLAAVGEMAAKLAHEVRTPLGIIRSSAQLVDRQTGLDEAGHEMLSFMVNECDRMNQLVTGLLESARPREPEFRVHDVHLIVLDVLGMLRERFEHRRLHCDTALVADSDAECDRNQVVQVLLNLLMNAAQAVPSGGHIRISSHGDAQTLTIVVDDDGPGIPAASREEVLEPFVSHRAGGIGLGLSVVREIVHRHGGRLAVGDSPLGGASMAFTLPRRQPRE